LSQSSSDLLIDNRSEIARSRSVESENTEITTASSITKSGRSACTLVQDILKNTAFPAIVEISMVPIAVRVSERVHVGLSRVQSISVPVCIPGNGVQVSLDKDTRKSNGVSWIVTRSTVRSSGRERNMRFMVGRVEIHAIPAHREVNLSTDTAGARDGRKRIIFC
jgi:hypothetical protein